MTMLGMVLSLVGGFLAGWNGADYFIHGESSALPLFILGLVMLLTGWYINGVFTLLAKLVS